MGFACIRSEERVSASIGQLKKAETRFETNQDVSMGGVLLALPALLANGILRHVKKHYTLPYGFYSIHQIFLTLAFMVLLRLKSPENLRNIAPGEFGKLIGLDRVPEVKTLRKKLDILSSQKQAYTWSAELSKDWMEYNPDAAGTLYIDGHIKTYYGKQTKLPRRYVSRQRLCLRGMSNYWVNDYLGAPFFVINKALNKGLLSVLESDVISRLLKDVPNQPTEKQLKSNHDLYRFMLVFDREGYSPSFFKLMWEKRIACCTYRKFVKDEWDISEFENIDIKLSNGETEEVKLAERGVFLGKKIWLREIRKLTGSGHQTSIVTTDFIHDKAYIAPQMFTRWCQENFFKYMSEHFGIDRLIDYQTEDIDATASVVNPEYRRIEYKIKSTAAKLGRRKVKLFGKTRDLSKSEFELNKTFKNNAELLEEIEFFEHELTQLKEIRKGLKRHVTIAELPESEKFKSLAKDKKLIIDTVKMIAYRAETAMVGMIRKYMSRKDDARALLRQVFKTDADIKADYENNILEVSLHHLTNKASDVIIKKLCVQINDTETIYPGTKLKLFVKLGSS